MGGFFRKEDTYGLLNFHGCWMNLGVAKLKLYTWVELYLLIHDIDCLYCVLGGGTGEPIICSRG